MEDNNTDFSVSNSNKDFLTEDIDDNFNFDQNNNSLNNSGISVLINHSSSNFERLPMLEIILDRFIRFFISDLRSSTSDKVSADIHSISSLRFDDYIREVPMSTITTICKIKELNNVALIVLDRKFVESMTNILLGGWRFNKIPENGEKSYTTIEKKIVEYIIGIIFQGLQSAFSLVTNLSFSIERLELNPKFATIVQPSDGVVLMQIRVDIDKSGGVMEIVLPYLTLEPIIELLKKVFTVSSLKDVEKWNQYFRDVVHEMDVELEAVLGSCTISLEKFKSLNVGDVITLDNYYADNDLIININGQKTFAARSGCVGDRIAAKISDIL